MSEHESSAGDEMIRLPMLPGPEKPLFGRPCNGCGYCCHEEVCRIGVAVLGPHEAPCQALVFRDGRAWCDVVMMSEKHSTVEEHGWLLATLAIERGCDSDDPVSPSGARTT